MAAAKSVRHDDPESRFCRGYEVPLLVLRSTVALGDRECEYAIYWQYSHQSLLPQRSP
jgi:hypothetical protein